MARSIILTDGEVALAVPEREDFQLDVLNDPFARTWARGVKWIYNDPEKAYKDAIQIGAERTLSVLYKGEFAGFVGWKYAVAPIPEIWIELYRNRFQGVGTRAIRLALTNLFALEGEEAVFAITMKRNVAAQRAMEKAGMHVFGRTRKTFKTGRKTDGAVWMIAYADRWLRENREYVKRVLEVSGYPSEILV